MLKTVIESEVLKKFITDMPNFPQYENVEAHTCWNSFYKFLKNGTDLQLSIDDESINSPLNSFIGTLTTGRKGTKLFYSKFKKPYKEKLPKDTNPHSIFFLDNNNQIDKLKKKNGFAFSNVDSYLQLWKQLSLNCSSPKFSVSKTNNQFKNWELIDDFSISITDIVIIDAYIMGDDSLLKANLYSLINTLLNRLQNRINLTIVTYSDNRNPIDLEKNYKNIRVFLNDENLNVNLSILLTNFQNKIHDRAIITNYYMIESGDSFNYFNSKGEVITKGTTISINSLCNNEVMKIADAKLNEVKKAYISSKNSKEELIIGDVNGNRLLV